MSKLRQAAINGNLSDRVVPDLWLRGYLDSMG